MIPWIDSRTKVLSLMVWYPTRLKFTQLESNEHMTNSINEQLLNWTTPMPHSLATLVKLAALLGCSLLGGCAQLAMSDNHHSRVRVSVSCGAVQDVGAVCRVATMGGSVSFSTPAELVLPNSWAPVSLSCEGEMVGSVTATLLPKPNIGLMGNVLFGGLPGAVIDTATGKGFNYDRHVSLHRASCIP